MRTSSRHYPPPEPPYSLCQRCQRHRRCQRHQRRRRRRRHCHSTRQVIESNDFTVGWICALPIEFAASVAMLDETYPVPPLDRNDSNTYALGRIREHKVVCACLPAGAQGMHAAATAANDLQRSFPNVRFRLLVGIGGGAPAPPSNDPLEDLHLGDVVVSCPGVNHGGVVQYDFGKTITEGNFIKTRSINRPPAQIMSAVAKLNAEHLARGNSICESIFQMLESNPRMTPKFQFPGTAHDVLFDADYNHNKSGKNCEQCDTRRLLTRGSRETREPVVHYGLIGSANRVMRDGITRERLRQEHGILCFDMEAAGLVDNFPCLVIRGICDYSDSHKNKRWQPYAAAAAAAYAKELLNIAPPVV
ncbi:hypothetical protein I7I50_05111 [Histoplasma capsulatum G186AR]|nr:hypothetical protein I7I52_03369 [Histoplasma capsulatum]QSS75837.1 hypothetical protein I7I50_05111 [Histoplasma capsulatum G186AR]